MSTTNKYQLTENILHLHNVTQLFTNITTSPDQFLMFLIKVDCIAALNHIRCTVPKYATPE